MSKIHRLIPLDLLIILIWIVTTIIFVITPFGNTLIKTILGIPMILFIPGYVLVSVLFVKIDDLDDVKRIALSFGLSIAVIPLLGLLLNFTFGLRPMPVLFTLCVYDIVFILISKYRREKLSEDKRFSVRFDGIYESICIGLKPKGALDFILTIILIFTTVLAIGMIYYSVATPKVGERLTEFYVLDTNGKTIDYPTYIKLGNSSNILLYISNHEYQPINYTLQVMSNNTILANKELRLDNNEVWTQNITFKPDKEEYNKKLEFLLFKENDLKNPYRELYLWINAYKG
jgi:uncharacterized membrane protein